MLLALSFPKTDALIRRLRPRCRAPPTWGSASLSYLVGHKRQAPVWMRRAGIEWLHRLAHEPGRLWRPYLVQGLPFAARMATAAAVARVQHQLGGPWFAHPAGAKTFGSSRA